MEGWVKIHKKFVNWEWYDDINTKTVFLHLLLSANYVNKNWKGIEIKRGQKITSLNNLAKETNLSIQAVRTSLKRLKSTHEITIETTNKYTLITIEKYNDYQDDTFKINKQNNNLPNNRTTNK